MAIRENGRLRQGCSCALAGFTGMSRGADGGESDKGACRSQSYDTGERGHGDISFGISVQS